MQLTHFDNTLLKSISVTTSTADTSQIPVGEEISVLLLTEPSTVVRIGAQNGKYLHLLLQSQNIWIQMLRNQHYS